MRLKDQRVVVLGGTSGVGLAIAERAMAEGASVVVAGNSAESAGAARDKLGNVEALSFDIGDEVAVKAAFESVGAFDYLVTTAAKLTYAPLVNIPVDAVQAMLATEF